MKNKLFIIKSFLILFLISSCNKDDGAITTDFVVAFENPSVSFEATDTEKDISLIFSRPATENSTISVKYTATNAEYGSDKDFITVPAANSQGIITINVKSGDTGASFKFNKLKTPIEGENKSVSFNITNVDAPLGKIQGNINLQVSFTETASLGSNLAPEVGGPNEPNQVYIDLSSEKSTVVKRDTWDFGFYSGNDYRVVINGSIYMAVKELDATDIDAVKPEDVADLQGQVAVGTFNPSNEEYIDNPSGNISETAIKEIVVTEADNKVYLVNAGFEVGTAIASIGGVKITGDSRGWKKIRIVRDGDNYKLLYANLDETTHKEAVISKKSGYNFNFFSLDTEGEVNVEPEASKWDLNFSVFTNVISGYGSYGYSDFVVHNRKGGVQSYLVETSTSSYEDFTLSNVDDTSFSKNQTTVGSTWRNVINRSIKDDKFYVLKDTDDNIYKIKFTALVNESGERGHPKFEYALLQ